MLEIFSTQKGCTDFNPGLTLGLAAIIVTTPGRNHEDPHSVHLGVYLGPNTGARVVGKAHLWAARR